MEMGDGLEVYAEYGGINQTCPITDCKWGGDHRIHGDC